MVIESLAKLGQVRQSVIIRKDLCGNGLARTVGQLVVSLTGATSRPQARHQVVRKEDKYEQGGQVF